MKKRKLPLLIAFFSLACGSTVLAQSAKEAITDYLKTSAPLSKDVKNREFTISHQENSESLKGTLVSIKQTQNGIPIFGNDASLLIRDNKVLHFSGDFTSKIASKQSTSGIETASAIMEKAVKNLHFADPAHYANLVETEKISKPELVYIDNGGTLQLAYTLEFYEKNSSNLWYIVADAQSGQVYYQQNLTLSCNYVNEPYKRNHNHLDDLPQAKAYPQFQAQQRLTPLKKVENASYRVLEFPVEAPTFGGRTLAVNPWDLTASPAGWQNDTTTEYTITRGNNAHAYTDENSSNTIGFSPDGGAAHVFDFPMPLDGGLDDYTSAAVTNLFYANNKIHDVLYKFGFTETSKNFQANNFGKGGAQNDYVLAEARDGANVSDLSLGIYNNANFSTPSDGSRPRMQMYIWLGPGPYFFYNAPAPVAGTSIASIGLGYFGPPLWKAPKTGDVAVASILDACTALPAGSLTGKIGIAQRGTCNFILKVKNMEDAGAIAGIIFNNPDAATSPGEAIINMSGDGATAITIPSVFIPQSQGENIVSLTNSGQTVNVTLKLPVFDGNLDNGIVIHEYGHGLSNRTTGTAVTCLNTNLDKEQMGEGWSDFTALMLTLSPTDSAALPRAIGTYAVGEPTNGQGIRPAQYSPNFEINGYTYGDTNGMEYTNANGQLVPDVHSIGFVWASMLWDLHWKYVEKYGYNSQITADPNSGSARVFQMVLNGLKLQGCLPTFVMGRDGILAADQAATGGADKCVIWNAFAKRGLGLNASAGSKTNINDQVEDFEVPTECEMATSETSRSKALSIYPNPAKNEFFLNIKGEVLGKVNVEIFDATGRLLSSQKVDAKSKEALSTSGLANGVYVVKATGLGFEYSSKLIVNK